MKVQVHLNASRVDGLLCRVAKRFTIREVADANGREIEDDTSRRRTSARRRPVREALLEVAHEVARRHAGGAPLQPAAVRVVDPRGGAGLREG